MCVRDWGVSRGGDCDGALAKARVLREDMVLVKGLEGGDNLPSTIFNSDKHNILCCGDLCGYMRK